MGKPSRQHAGTAVDASERVPLQVWYQSAAQHLATRPVQLAGRRNIAFQRAVKRRRGYRKPF